jgi:hypothetical protein
MALKTIWSRSAEHVVTLPATGGGCRLASPRLLGTDRPIPRTTVKHTDPKDLVAIGVSKALKGKRAVLLQLTGQRGRPQQRIVLLPIRASTESPPVAAKPSPKARTAKENLEIKIENLNAKIKTLRVKSKETRQDLDAAESKISELEELGTQAGQNSSRDQEEYEEEIARLQECIAAERAAHLNARLKSQARIDELESPIHRAQTAMEQETEDRITKLTSAVQRYKAENKALEAELTRLRASNKPGSAPSPDACFDQSFVVSESKWIQDNGY